MEGYNNSYNQTIVCRRFYKFESLSLVMRMNERLCQVIDYRPKNSSRARQNSTPNTNEDYRILFSYTISCSSATKLAILADSRIFHTTEKNLNPIPKLRPRALVRDGRGAQSIDRNSST